MTLEVVGLCLRARQSLSLVAGLQWRTSAKEFVSLRAICIRTTTDYHLVYIFLLTYCQKRA
jgi:hypothetical protein